MDLLVIVAELDEEKVARLHSLLDIVPDAFADGAFGAASVLGVVDYTYFVVNKVFEDHAPAALGTAQ